MARLVPVLVLLVAACRPTAPLREGFAAQAAALTPPEQAQALEDQRALACPLVPRGCFSTPPACNVTWCFCPRICAPALSTGRVWQRTVAECLC